MLAAISARPPSRAPADGYTLMLTAAPFAIAPALFKDLSFHPVKDFSAITQIAIVPLLVVTRPESPLATMADLIDAAKNADVTYATFGVGSPPHLVGEKIQQLANVKMRQIPYKGGQAALADIVSGTVTIAILDVVSMAPLVKSGRLKALSITGPVRSAALPDLPTLSQQNLPFDGVGWYGLLRPPPVRGNGRKHSTTRCASGVRSRATPAPRCCDMQTHPHGVHAASYTVKVHKNIVYGSGVVKPDGAAAYARG